MTTADEVRDYYSKTWKDLDDQGLTKPNTRHLMILDKARRNGLRRNATVLEIGCGIGTLSSVLGKYLTSGKLVAVDISPGAIDLARYKFGSQKNIEFQVSDMSDWENDKKFDFIFLPDVLEHIPLDQHDNLFKRLKKVSHPETMVFVNIPHPRMLRYCREHRPELLQIIDIPIPLDVLSKTVYENGFETHSMESYSIGFVSEDYQFLVLKDDRHKSDWRESDKLTRAIQFYKLLLRRVF